MAYGTMSRTVTKQELGTDSRGNYRRRLGKRQDGHIQTFYLGTDRKEAMRRNAILEGLWTKTAPTWTPAALQAALQVARGISEIEITPPDDLRGELQRIIHRDNVAEAQALGLAVKGTGQLHGALREYAEHLKAKNQTPDRKLTEWGVKLVELVQRFIDHHADLGLAALNLKKCEELLTYWCQRPKRKDTGKPISKNTARNMRIQLMGFFKWLGREEKYGWNRPAALSDFRSKIPLTDAEKGRRGHRLPTFTLDELGTLYKAATPRVKLMMLLALNCAFKQAEIGSLLKCEVHFAHVHPHYRKKGDYIFRVRRKSGVYGEWKLWPETAALLADAMKNSKLSEALSTTTGESYSKLTSGGNHNMKIPSLWNCLLRKVPEVQKLPFTSLVDTAVDMVREIAGGEVSAVFKCHGKPVSDGLLDLYSGRPFDKVFEALDVYHERLRVVLV
jgi:hypothetical protein